jgi:hypothetical protein
MRQYGSAKDKYTIQDLRLQLFKTKKTNPAWEISHKGIANCLKAKFLCELLDLAP